MTLVPKSQLYPCRYSRTYVLTESCRVSRSVVDEIYSQFLGSNFTKNQWHVIFTLYFPELTLNEVKVMIQ